jgi:hypothetical protein
VATRTLGSSRARSRTRTRGSFQESDTAKPVRDKSPQTVGSGRIISSPAGGATSTDDRAQSGPGTRIAEGQSEALWDSVAPDLGQRSEEAARRIESAERRRVEDAVRSMLAEDGIGPDRIEIQGQVKGATDAATWRVNVTYERYRGASYWVKVGAAEEIESAVAGHKILIEPFGRAHILPVLYQGSGVMVTPCLLAWRSVEEMLWDGTEIGFAVETWSRYLTKVLSVWLRTMALNGYTSSRTVGRLMSRMGPTLAAGDPKIRTYATLPLSVNGVAFPSIEQHNAEALRLLGSHPPKAQVMGSNDEHCGNVMSCPGSDPSDFVVVDLGNAGLGDAAFAVAKMVHYALSYVLVNRVKDLPGPERSAVVRVSVGADQAAIDYTLGELPNGAQDLADRAVAAGDLYAGWVTDTGFRARLAASMWVCLFAGIPHHSGYPELIPALVGEAARLMRMFHPDPSWAEAK